MGSTSTSGPGRPPIGKRIEIRFSVEDIERIDAAARALGVTRPEFIRGAVTWQVTAVIGS